MKNSENAKKKIGDKNRENMKRLWADPEYRKKQIESFKGRESPMKGKNHSEETKEKIGNFFRGRYTKEKASNWQGGITPLNKILRTNSMFRIWREAVFLRDNFICQNPNCPYCHNKMGVYLHPHHIKPFAKFPELRFAVSNGITYCKEFHINSKILHKGILNGGNYDRMALQ